MSAAEVEQSDPGSEVVVHEVVEHPVSLRAPDHHRRGAGRRRPGLRAAAAGSRPRPAATRPSSCPPRAPSGTSPTSPLPARVTCDHPGPPGHHPRGCGRSPAASTSRASKWVLAITALCFVVPFLCWATPVPPATRSTWSGCSQNTIATAVPADPRRAGRHPLRALRRHQRGDRGPDAGRAPGPARWSAPWRTTSGSAWSAAMVAGALMGWLLAVFSIRYLVNQVVLGVVLNVLALGLTGFIYDALMQPNADSLNNPARVRRRSRSRCSPTSRSSGRCCSTRTSSSTSPTSLIVRGRRRAVPHPLGAADPRGRRAPQGGRHGRHQGACAPATATS